MTCLRVVRRPPRLASAKRKCAKQKALIRSRQDDSLLNPTLLTTHSFAECAELHPALRRVLVEDMGLRTMTEVQSGTLAAAAGGRDVLAQARTGTGKTLAFLIPAVERITLNPTHVPGRTLGCLVVAPREGL